MRSDRRIAWTRHPHPETEEVANEQRVELVVVPALRKMPLLDREQIRDRVLHASTLVITSETTLDMLEHHRCLDVLHHLPALVVGTTSARRLDALGGHVAGIARSSAELWAAYGAWLDASALHLGGADVAAELPIPRLAVYVTVPMYPLVPRVEATAIFSPRGAASVLTSKNLHRTGRLLSIGPTTTHALKHLGHTVHLTAREPSETTLLRSYLEALL